MLKFFPRFITWWLFLTCIFLGGIGIGLPTHASEESTLLASQVNEPFCYLEMSDGRILNLNQLCIPKTLTAIQQLLTTKQCQGCNLQRANLANVNLKGANLSGADLSGANLSGTNLTGANIKGAILRGANIKNTVMPTGVIFRRSIP
ncbi:pentapeptide repeat-containing protein [Allocoleopsis sp.]|uniref:pentapeptide repeat-containing protein n=1 Tax=Allocoleopsis sp. TaxID=3088169 RepID=UPI002FD1D4E0